MSSHGSSSSSSNLHSRIGVDRMSWWERGVLPAHPLIGVPVLFIEMLIMMVPSAPLPDLLLKLFDQSYPLSALSTGLADTCGGVAAFLLSPAIGAWSDVHGRKSMLFWLSLVSFVPILCLTLYPTLNLWYYLATRGLTKLSAFGVLFACIADLSDARHRSPLYSRLSGFGLVAMVAGPFISMKTSTLWSFRICGIMAAATLLYIALLPETIKYKQAKERLLKEQQQINQEENEEGEQQRPFHKPEVPRIRNAQHLQAPLLSDDSNSSSSSDTLSSLNAGPSSDGARRDQDMSVVAIADDADGNAAEDDAAEAASAVAPLSPGASLPTEPVSAGVPDVAAITSPKTMHPLALIRLAFRLPAYRRISFVLFFGQLSQNGIHSCAQLFLKKSQHYTKDNNNWLLLVMGAWAVVLMTLVVPYALAKGMQRCRLRTVILVGLMSDFCHQWMYIVLPSFSYFYLIALFQGLSFITYPAGVGVLSRCGSEADQGFVLAMSAGIRSLTQAIAPIAFNGLLSYFSWDHAFVRFPAAPFILAMVCILTAAILALGLQEAPLPTAQGNATEESQQPTHQPHALCANGLLSDVEVTVEGSSSSSSATSSSEHKSHVTDGNRDASPLPRRVLIFHGPINAGKTSAARQWVAEQRRQGKRVGGVLAEKTAQGRVFVDLLATNGSGGDNANPLGPAHQCALEPSVEGESTVLVGRFRFRHAAFTFAVERIESAAGLPSLAATTPAGGRPVLADAVVIDEFGPLEVRGEGFADVLQRMLHLPPSHAPKLLVLLVRSTLVEQLAQSIRAADPHACIQFEPPME